MSEDQIQAGGIELELSNTKKNLMEALNQNADLQKRVEELEKSNAEYLVDLMALKCVSSQMRCAYCNHEMIDAHPGDGGVYIKKLVIEHMDKCEKHPLFEARKRIKELEAEIAGLKEVIIKAHDVLLSLHVCDVDTEYRDSMREQLKQALSTPTGSKLLDDLHELRRLLDCRAGKLLQQGKYFIVVSETEPYFSSVYEVIRLFEMGKGTWSGEDEIIYQKKVSNIRNDEFSSESLKLLIKLKAENSKLLSKVEAGERINEELATIRNLLSGASCGYGYELGFISSPAVAIIDQALSAYRAACEGGAK
jgi:hypothetical protein